jgi:hypothetical protein
MTDDEGFATGAAPALERGNSKTTLAPVVADFRVSELGGASLRRYHRSSDDTLRPAVGDAMGLHG